MSQRAGDLGSMLMGCGNQSQIDKYGSEKACINNIMFGQPETLEHKGSFWDGFDVTKDLIIYGQNPKDMKSTPETKEEKAKRLELLSDRIKNETDEVKKMELQIQQAPLVQELDKEAKRVRKQYIIYGLIAVAGYFAYKKFKK